MIQHDFVIEPIVKVGGKSYRIPEAHRNVVAEEVQKLLELNIIEESKSEWSSQIVLVLKPNGALSFFIDFRKLN